MVARPRGPASSTSGTGGQGRCAVARAVLRHRQRGQTSAVLLRNGTVYAVLTVTASAEGTGHVLWMVNPEKIAAVPVPA